MFIALSMNYHKTGKIILETWSQGLVSQDDIEMKQKIYGKCILDVPVKSALEILIAEVLHPFYIFQIFSVVVWMLDGYYYYSFVILGMAGISVVTALLLTKKQMEEIHKMAHYLCNIKVYRGHNLIELPSEQLLPGDLFEVPLHQRMPCDAVIVEGSCMVNESMLTGESVPILKYSIPKTYELQYSPDQATLHSLYEGTEVTEN